MDVDDDNIANSESENEEKIVYGYVRKILQAIDLLNAICKIILLYYYLPKVVLEYDQKQIKINFNTKKLLSIYKYLTQISSDDNNFTEEEPGKFDKIKTNYYVLKSKLEYSFPLAIHIHLHKDENTKKYLSTLKLDLKWSIRKEKNNKKYILQKMYYEYDGHSSRRNVFIYPDGRKMYKVYHLFIHLQINPLIGRFLEDFSGLTNDDGINAFWIMPELKTGMENDHRTCDMDTPLYEFQEKLKRNWKSDTNNTEFFIGTKFISYD